MDTVTEIRALRKISQTSKEIQVSHTDMLLFKAGMDIASSERLILIGEQDEAVERGLEKIGQRIEFARPTGCVVS